MPEANTPEEQKKVMEAQIDELNQTLVTCVNIQAIKYRQLMDCRKNRTASAPYIADVAKDWRQAANDTNKMIDRLIQIYVVYFDFVEKDIDTHPELQP